jgi:predicted transcriptional regulator/DNA-binding PadR family transcriptional regulator
MTSSRKTATRCALCGRSLSYEPGQASAVLTAHYRAKHPQAVTRKVWDIPQGKPREPRSVLILRVLADAVGGLSVGEIIDVLAERIEPRRTAVARYRANLRNLQADGEITAVSRKDDGTSGRPVTLWHITEAGRRRLAAADAASYRETITSGLHADAGTAEEARPAPDGIHRQFGAGTPAVIRRAAAAIFRAQGYTVEQIGRIFGVTAGTIGIDLRDAESVSAGPDADLALEQLAARAEEVRRARQALRDYAGHFGRGTPITIRREAAAVLHQSIGLSSRDIGAIFGVTAAPIQNDLSFYPPPEPGYDAAARIRELALQAHAATQRQ